MVRLEQQLKSVLDWLSYFLLKPTQVTNPSAALQYTWLSAMTVDTSSPIT